MKNATIPVQNYPRRFEDSECILITDSKQLLDCYAKDVFRAPRFNCIRVNCVPGRVKFEIIEQSQGEMYEFYAQEEDMVLLSKGSAIKTKATKTFITLHIPEDKLREDIRRNGIFINFSAGEAYICRTISNRLQIMNLNKDIRFHDEKDDVVSEILNESTLYREFNYTSSEIKKANICAVNTEQYDPEALCNMLTYGAHNKAVESGKLFDLSKYVTGGNRLGSNKSPSANMGIPTEQGIGLLIVNKPLKMFQWFTEDGEGYDTIDGATYVAAEIFADILTSALQIKYNRHVIICVEAVIGLQAQYRLGLTKCSGKIEAADTFARKLENIMDEYKEGEDYDIIGDRDNIGFIIDSNVNKNYLGFFGDYVNHPPRMRLMNIARPKNGVTLTRMQIINKFLNDKYINKQELLDVLHNLADKTMQNKVNNLLANKSRVLNLNDFENGEVTGYNVDILNSLNPELKMKDMSLMSQLTKNMVKGANNMVQDIRVDVEGTSTMLFMDDTAYMIPKKYRPSALPAEDNLYGVLNFGEVYCKRFIKEKVQPIKAEARIMIQELQAMGLSKEEFMEQKKAILKEADDVINSLFRYCIVIKFPAPGRYEMYVAKMLLDSEVRDRAKMLTSRYITNEEDIKRESRLLADNIINTEAGTLLMPSEEQIKKFLAGFDTDADSATVIWEEELVKLALKLPHIMVDIDSDDTSLA